MQIWVCANCMDAVAVCSRLLVESEGQGKSPLVSVAKGLTLRASLMAEGTITERAAVRRQSRTLEEVSSAVRTRHAIIRGAVVTVRLLLRVGMRV